MAVHCRNYNEDTDEEDANEGSEEEESEEEDEEEVEEEEEENEYNVLGHSCEYSDRNLPCRQMTKASPPEPDLMAAPVLVCSEAPEEKQAASSAKASQEQKQEAVLIWPPWLRAPERPQQPRRY